MHARMHAYATFTQGERKGGRVDIGVFVHIGALVHIGIFVRR
jgi:hypothetical protein